MLKDNEFNDIGKRLYDLEAEPPKDGWRKIAAGIPPAPKPGYFRKHWWKPLVLLVPVMIYISLPRGGDASLARVASVPGIEEPSTSGSQPADQNATATVTMPNDEATPSSDTEQAPPSTGAEQAAASHAVASTRKTSSDASLKTGPAPRVSQTDRSDNNTSAITNTSSSTAPGEGQTKETHATSSEQTDKKRKSTTRDGEAPASATPLVGGHANANNSTLLDLGTVKNNTEKNALHLAEQKNASDLTDSDAANNAEAHVAPGTRSNNETTNGSLSGEALVTGTEDNSSVSRSDATRSVDTAEIDSVAVEIAATPKPAVDSATAPIEQITDKKQTTALWRATVSFAPTYVIKTVRPVLNDEVLVTRMKNKSSYDRVGFGAALGLSREIRPNLFADVQLSYVRHSDEFSYMYTNGSVDTLIATRETDGSVRVVPVYLQQEASLRTTLQYGGARIGATYFFWTGKRRRFNVSAAGGINHLLSADVRQRSVSGWIPIDNSSQAQNTFSLTLSGGYNVWLGRGWEATINPFITYHSVKSNDYRDVSNSNQRAYGLTFMIARFF